MILGIAEDGSMIEMRQHLLTLAAALVVVADGLEDEAIVCVIYIVLVVSLRLEQSIACHLTVAFDVHSTCINETVEANKFEEGRVRMLLNDLFDAVERSADLTIATTA